MRPPVIILIILTLLLVGCAAPATQQREPFVYRLHGGERLRVSVSSHAVYPEVADIAADADGQGYVTLPLFGEIQVLGMTVGEVEESIRRKSRNMFGGEIG